MCHFLQVFLWQHYELKHAAIGVWQDATNYKKRWLLDPNQPKQTILGSSAETLTAHSMARLLFMLVAQGRVRAHTGNMHRYCISPEIRYE